MIQTDPAKLAPQVPKVMRDAASLVHEHGEFLGDAQDPLTARLNAPYAIRVQRGVRHLLLAGDRTDRDRVQALAALADQHGLTPSPPPPLRPVIDLGDIYLVCWTAITPSSSPGP